MGGGTESANLRLFQSGRGGGVTLFLIFSDKEGEGVWHILTFLTNSVWRYKNIKMCLIFNEFD